MTLGLVFGHSITKAGRELESFELEGLMVDGMNGILGMNAVFPAARLCRIMTSIAWQVLIRHRVPSVMLGGSKDLSTMIGQPIFRVSLCGGSPGTCKEFKNSTGK